MMGMMMPETCGAVFKRQVINLRSCCIWLVDSVENMMMHGIANSKLKSLKTYLYERLYLRTISVYICLFDVELPEGYPKRTEICRNVSKLPVKLYL